MNVLMPTTTISRWRDKAFLAAQWSRLRDGLWYGAYSLEGPQSSLKRTNGVCQNRILFRMLYSSGIGIVDAVAAIVFLLDGVERNCLIHFFSELKRGI